MPNTPPSPEVLAALSSYAAFAEGYGVPKPDGSPTVPTQANNPGDLKLGDKGNGTINGITIFETPSQGYAALNRQMSLAVTDGSNSRYNPNMTIQQFGTQYSGGDPNWSKNFAAKAGVPETTTLGDLRTQLETGQLPISTFNQVNPAGAQPNANQSTGAVNPSDRPDLTFVPLQNNDINDAQFAALSPNVVVLAGLDEVPWFQDQGMVLGNKPGRSQVTPISFTVVLDDNGGPFVLSSKGRNGVPVQIQLEANLQEMNIQMKHIFFKKPSRTGIHITFWGMQADLIEGRGSTGVMMNQLGLTDFMSVANATQDLIQLVASGFQHSSTDVGSNPVRDNSGNILEESPDVFTQTVQQQTNTLPSSFRVAAQDAFQELLSLFKMNGVTWFPGGDAPPGLPNQSQDSTAAWSPSLGATSYQIHGRNNDVMSRGAVIMVMEGNSYQGYFKTLSWTQDANDPYQWHFNFVFQVERTSTLLYYPS